MHLPENPDIPVTMLACFLWMIYQFPAKQKNISLRLFLPSTSLNILRKMRISFFPQAEYEAKARRLLA